MKASLVSEDLSGTLLSDRFHLTRKLGAGGMGSVYLARDRVSGGDVAVKVLGARFVSLPDVVTRFVREGKVLAQLESKHIVRVLHTDVHAGRPYLVMDLLRGEDLGERLRKQGKLPLGETLRILSAVLKALHSSHARGIVHRDLKPDNIFLEQRGGIKVLDFGLSKVLPMENTTLHLGLTGGGRVVGTPLYLSPEQARAQHDIDGRADLYALGAVAYECLTGRPPHVGNTNEQVLLAHCMEDARSVHELNAEVPLAVSHLVEKALRRDREARFATAEAFLTALRQVRSTLIAERILPKPPKMAAGKRTLALMAVSGLLCGLLVGALVAFLRR